MLTEGPDVIFDTTDLDSTGETFEVRRPDRARGGCVWRALTPLSHQVWAAQFFTNPGLHLYRVSTRNASVVGSVAVDQAMGAAEGVQAVDLNGDGRLDLLANSHLGGSGGAVYAYELPQDLASGSVKRHTLASGFKVRACLADQSYLLARSLPLSPGHGKGVQPGSARIHNAVQALRVGQGAATHPGGRRRVAGGVPHDPDGR